MNTQIRRLGLVLLALYGALFVQLNVLQVGRQRELNSNSLNTRPTVIDYNRTRGEIITARESETWTPHDIYLRALLELYRDELDLRGGDVRGRPVGAAAGAVADGRGHSASAGTAA